MRKLLQQILPPIIVNTIRNRRQRQNRTSQEQPNALHGNYPDWSAALSQSDGYDANHILEKTKNALLKVKNGDAVSERDTVLFNEIHYTWPVLSTLMWVAAKNMGKLNVLDFGGSLGSTYYQNKAFLDDLPHVRWNIVEQPQYIEVGEKNFADEVLHFYTDIETCLAETEPNLILFCGVLQYLPEPFQILDQVFKLTHAPIVVDRTSFWVGEKDHLAVQTVPPDIYEASYPSWIFAKEPFVTYLQENGGNIMGRYINPDKLAGPVPFVYGGFIVNRE